MKRDYASRGRTSTPSRSSSRRPTTSRSSARKSPARKASPTKNKGQSSATAVSFNAPSFSIGLILGAVAVLFLPELNALFEAETGTQPVPAPEVPELVFNYDTLLSHSEVTTDTDAYPVSFEDPEAVSDAGYLLQAASFRLFAEAADLQAKLSKQQLPAEVSRVMVKDQLWFRVTVGPFNRHIEAQRAVTRLRENNLAPMYLKRG